MREDEGSTVEAQQRWVSREEALFWFEDAAWIARARITAPAWYSENAEDYVDVFCWVYQSRLDADWTGPDDDEDEEPEENQDETEQQTLLADGGTPTAGTSRRPIAREHLLGATVWAYGGGSAHVKPWVRPHQFSRFGGVRDAE